jgi:hypothetical protein
MAQIDVPITIDEAKNLAAIMWENKKIDLTSLSNRLENAISKMPNGAFIRLGSRSPKDSWYIHEHGLKVANSKEALSLLLGDSERVLDDLCLAINENYQPHIWIRQWVDIPKWAEFRCFMQDKKLVGISQYYYKDGSFPEIISSKDSIVWAIENFFIEFKQIIHLDNVVFDVWVKLKTHDNTNVWEIKLIEINPYFELTDPCLFNWHNPVDFKGQLKYIEDTINE